MMHTLRQGNYGADHLAELGRMQQEEDIIILHHPPHSMHQLLFADMAHVAYSRYAKLYDILVYIAQKKKKKRKMQSCTYTFINIK